MASKHKPASGASKEIPTMDQVLEIALDQIEVSTKFNSRKTYARIDELGASIKAQGQMVPVIVVPQQGKARPFRLLAGHRRLMAITGLKWPTVKAVVRGVDSERDAFVANFTENVARDDLTSFEVATSLRRLRDDYGMTSKDIQATLNVTKGYSKSNINNLISAVEKLHPKILKAWEAENPACTLMNINDWKSLTHDEQIAEFDRVVSAKEDTSEGGSEGADKGSTAARGPSRSKIEKALTAAKEAENADVVECLRWVLGKVQKLKDGEGNMIFDPKAKAKDDADEE